MRRLTGVPEDLLDEVPSEEPRYTGMAWAMLGTGALATVGMAVLVQTLDANLSRLVIGVVSLGWGIFILGIDYSIVSYIDERKALAKAQQVLDADIVVPTSLRSGGAGRLAIRLLLAAILGLAVGESLVISAFGSQSTKALTAEMVDDLLRRICETDLQLAKFRPEIVPGPRCSHLLGASMPTPSTTTTVAPSGSEQTASSGDPELDAERSRLKDLEAQELKWADTARCEERPEGFTPERRAELGCSGVPGNGLARQVALDNLATVRSSIATTQDRINGLLFNKGVQDNRTAEANSAKTTAEAEAIRKAAEEAANARDSKEAQELVDTKNQLQAKVRAIESDKKQQEFGLSERFEATERYVNPWIRWGLRLLFIIVDLTPVLIKLTLGVSAVDQMIAIRRRESIYPFLQELQEVESAYYDGRKVRDLLVASADPEPRQESTFRRVWGLARDHIDTLIDRAAHKQQDGDESDRSVPQSESHSVHDEQGTQTRPPENGEPRSASGSTGSFENIGNKLFMVDQQIGSGNYATVWLARIADDHALESGVPLVIKRPVRAKEYSRARQKESREALRREYERYEALRGRKEFPRLIAGDQTGIVLQYYPRTSIDRWFFSDPSQADPFSWADVVGWLLGITRGLENLWELRYVHGDGKPANIVLTGGTDTVQLAPNEVSNEVRLIDLGTSVAMGTTVPTISPGYAPPEAFRETDYVATPLIDVFSFLGCTLYYLASGGVDPWSDQVHALLPTQEVKPGSKSLRAYTEALKAANRDNVPTPLERLQHGVPAPVIEAVSTWMAPDEKDRLALPGQPDPQWRIGREWQNEDIGRRLQQQIARLESELKDLGPTYSMPTLGRRHTLARNPQLVPDETVDVTPFIAEEESV